MGGGRAAVHPEPPKLSVLQAAERQRRRQFASFAPKLRTALRRAAALDAVLTLWLWLAATYEPRCAGGGGGAGALACWLPVAVDLRPWPAAHDESALWLVAAACAAARCVALVAGLCALRVLANRTRRTPRDFLLRTEDPRLVALLPELFDAGRSVNRNAEAADIRELHGQISASLGCPAWVASFLSVWVDGGERPLRSAALMPADAHLKLSTAKELASQLRADRSPPQLQGRRWARVLAAGCVANFVWCVVQPEIAAVGGPEPWTAVLLWQGAVTCAIETTHLLVVGFWGDAMRHSGRTGALIAWELVASSAAVLAAVQCGSANELGAGSAPGSSGFFCYVDGSAVTEELADWQLSHSHIDAAAVSVIRSCAMVYLLLSTDLADQRRRVVWAAWLCALSCVAPVVKVVLWSVRGSLTVSEVVLAAVGLTMGVLETICLSVAARRAKPLIEDEVLKKRHQKVRQQGPLERRCRWCCNVCTGWLCGRCKKMRPPDAPAILFRPGTEMRGLDGQAWVVGVKGKQKTHIWKVREKPKGFWRQQCRRMWVWTASRAIICGHPLCKGYATERAKQSVAKGDRAFAEEQWRKAIVLYEIGLPVLTRGKHLHAALVSRVHNDIGICHLNIRNEVDAERSFRAAIDTIEQLPSIKRMPEFNTDAPNADALFNLGSQLQRRGELLLARPHLQEAIGARPSFTKARLNLAVLHAELGHSQLAKEELQRVVDREPHNAQARIHRVLLRLNQLGPKSTSRKTRAEPETLAWMRAELDEATNDGKQLDNPEVAHLLACVVHSQALLLVPPGEVTNVIDRLKLASALLDDFEIEEQPSEENDRIEPLEDETRNSDAAQNTAVAAFASAAPALLDGEGDAVDGNEQEAGDETEDESEVDDDSVEPREDIVSASIQDVRDEATEAGERRMAYHISVVERGFNDEQPWLLAKSSADWLALFTQVKDAAATDATPSEKPTELRPLLDSLQRCRRHIVEDEAHELTVFSSNALAQRRKELESFLLQSPSISSSVRALILEFLPRPSAYAEAEAAARAEKDARLKAAAKAQAEDAAFWEGRIEGGVFSKAVNWLERKTGLDLDGDGDVGVTGTLIVAPEEPKKRTRLPQEAERLLELAVEYYETALRLQPTHIPEDGMNRQYMMPFGRLARMGQPLALDTLTQHRHHLRLREQAFVKIGMAFALSSLEQYEVAEAWCSTATKAFIPDGLLELPLPYRVHMHYILGRPQHWPHRPEGWREACAQHLQQLADLNPGDEYRDSIDLLRHWHERQGDSEAARRYGDAWEAAQETSPYAVPSETDPILALRACYLPFGVAPPDARPFSALSRAAPPADSDLSSYEDSSASEPDDLVPEPEPEEPEDIGLAAKIMTRKATADYEEVLRRSRSLHANALTEEEEECLLRGAPTPEGVMDKLKDVLVGRGKKGIENFGKALRVKDPADGDARGLLSSADFSQFMADQKLGLSPTEIKVLFGVFDLSEEGFSSPCLDYEDLFEQLEDWDPLEGLPSLVDSMAALSGTDADRAARHERRLMRRKLGRSDLQPWEDDIRTKLVDMDDEQLKRLRRGRELSRKATLVLQDASGSELITKNHLDRQIIDLQLEVEMLRGTGRGGALKAKERELEEARTHRSKLKAKVKEKVSQQLHHLPREMEAREARWRERRKGSSAKYAIKDTDADSP